MNKCKEKVLILRLMWCNKIYSVNFDSNKSIGQLKRFISFAFKEDTRDFGLNLIYLGTHIKDDDLRINEIFKDQRSEVFVSLKSQKESETNPYYKHLKELEYKTKTSLIASEEFDVAEKLTFKAYSNYLDSKNIDYHNRIQCMPLFHSNFKNRVSSILTKNDFTMDNHIIEHYPIRNYFQFGLYLRLFFMFLLFGFSVKGINFPIFICILLVYYW